LVREGLLVVAVGWQSRVSLTVAVVLFKVKLMVGAVGWLLWVVSLVVSDVLFNSVFIMGVVGRHGLMSVAVLRWRMYCVMLVVGLRW
jgi:hypothetical protein